MPANTSKRKPSATAGLLRRFYEATRFAFPQRGAVLLILVLMLLVAVIGAVEPLVTKWLIDALTSKQPGAVLLWGIGLLAACAIVREIIEGIANWLTWRTRIGVQYALLESTIGKLHTMPIRLQRSEGIGALMTRLDRSIQGFTAAVTLILFSILPSAVFMIIAGAIMLQLDWRLALVVLAFSPIPALIAAFAGPEQAERERSLLDRWSRIYSRFNEVLSAITVVRSFAMEQAEKTRFLRAVARANRTVIRGVATDARYASAANLSAALARITAICVGGWLVLKDELTIGTVVAFLGYVSALFGPVQSLSGVYSSVRRASVFLNEIFSMLELQEQLDDSASAVEVTHIKGAVYFHDVHFRYEDAHRPLLAGISLHVAEGHTVAILGPSGSGKSTLMAMLMRFYDPLQGNIYIDGRDLRTIKLASLRRHIGVVLQDPMLFNDSVRANIVYGRPNATAAQVEAAAKAAYAHTFIERLPRGYDTVVGERGSFLSVGERQRITIARAILKDPRILVLDEPTSALDAEAEEAVQAGITALTRGRTTFVIAHRLSTVVSADQIVVLKDGKILEQGTHGELMRQGAYYAGLVRCQQRGLSGDVAPDGYSFRRSAPPVLVGPR
jgi:ATP-binding cassette, subfamily B, bacterial